MVTVVGSDDMRLITPELLGRYFLWLTGTDGQTGRTARKHRRTLGAILRVAKRRKLIRIRLSEIPMPQADSLRPRAWSMEEFQALLQCAYRIDGTIGPWRAGDWLVGLMVTTFCTDWRISAVMRLRTADCNFERATARSIDKRRRERVAPLTEQCVYHLKLIWDPSREEVFGDWPKDRHSRQWSELNDLLGGVIKAAGVPDIGRWHAIRKSVITEVAKRHGVEAASRFAGHSSTRVTWNHYVDESLLEDRSLTDTLPTFRIDPGQSIAS
ncbi:MAG: tyrosine-type recombinase/integrase [Pirellulales bacterium]